MNFFYLIMISGISNGVVSLRISLLISRTFSHIYLRRSIPGVQTIRRIIMINFEHASYHFPQDYLSLAEIPRYNI